MKNVIWLANINVIGGVESVIWNIIREYKDKDITIWYNHGDAVQIKRMSKYVRLIKFNPKDFIECDNIIINYDYKSIEGHFKAKRIIYMVHANYKYLKDMGMDIACTDPRFEYYAVSQWAADNYYDVTGIKPTVCYNPIIVEDKRDALLIVSATRISSDKGKLSKRMELLANRLDERNIPFIWLVFTNSTENINNRNVLKVSQRLDILPFLRKADFVAQLSDTEAFCMTVLESVSVGTPVLITKIPSFEEMGLNDTNAIYFDFDMFNIDECIDKMISKKFKFSYTPNKDIWDELLAPGEKTYFPKFVKVKVLIPYYDLELDTKLKENEELEMFEERAKYLESRELVEIIERGEENVKGTKSKRSA